MNSIEKYPLRLETGSECKILYGFGDKICDAIDQKLNIKKSTATPTKTLYKTTSMSNFDHRKQPNKLIDLSDNENDDDADDDCSPPPAKQQKLSTETKKNARTITKTTSAGPKLFANLASSSNQPTTISTLLGIANSPMQTSQILSTSHRILKPGSFHIKLCVDNAEASRLTQKVLLEHLKKNSIQYDVRKLNIGDFLWLVQRRFDFSQMFRLKSVFSILS